MAQIRKPIDVYPLIRAEIERVTGARVTPILPASPVTEPTVHIYLAGGYRKSEVTHRIILMCHCYGATSADAYDLATTVSGIVTSRDYADWWSGSVVTGPYDNPFPDYPEAQRVTAQLECNTGTRVVNL